MSAPTVVRSNFPEFGYEVKSAFEVPRSRNPRVAYNDANAPRKVKGVLAAFNFAGRGRGQAARIGLGFVVGEVQTHPDVLLAHNISRDDERLVHPFSYKDIIWRLGCQFEWADSDRNLDIDLFLDAGQENDVLELDDRRSLAAVIGLACGKVVMDRLDIDSRRATIDVSVAPNFLTRPRAASTELKMTPFVMAQLLEALES